MHVLCLFFDLTCHYVHTDEPAAAAQAPPPQLPELGLAPLARIFDDPKINAVYTDNGKEAWKCGWCNVTFQPKHATRALIHVNKVRNKGIKICPALIPDEHRERYRKLYESTLERKVAVKRAQDAVDAYTEENQMGAVSALIQKKLKMAPVGGGLQQDIATAMENISAGDLRVANTAQLDMAIANFWHCDNIPDAAVESPRFKYLLKCARLVSKEYKPPHRKRIAGELLDLNYANRHAENKAMVTKEADTFGLSHLTDGATVKKMPLLNVICLTASCAPVTMSIIDATEHLQDGQKKDARFIAHYMEDVVKEIDPDKKYTDLFF